ETSQPPFEGRLSTEEEETWIKQPSATTSTTQIQSFEDVLLSRLIIMGGLGAGLALFWFGLPRMVWPERYLKSVAASYAASYAARVPLPRPQMPRGVPMPNVPGRSTPGRPPVQRPAGPPSAKPDPAATMGESKVTI